MAMGGTEELRRHEVQLRLCGVSGEGPEDTTKRVFWQPRGSVAVVCPHEFIGL